MVACFVNRRLLLLCAVTALRVAPPELGFFHEERSLPIPSSPEVLRVVTWNLGQHEGHSIGPFLDQSKMDVLALQECSYNQAGLRSGPGRAQLPHLSQASEFILLSRYPILNAQMIVTQASGRRGLRAARYEVQLPTWTVVVYNVHLPSPRKELKGQWLAIRPSESTRQFWQDQEMLMQQVLQHMESEVLPVVVCGDWNAPPVGPLYRRMTAQLTDAHMAFGGGAGYTFPGDLWNPLTLGKPWLRLDYILCNVECEVLQCETEAPSEAQNAAVGAVLRIR